MNETNEFKTIIDHLSNPLTEKKANFYGVLTGMLLTTWLLWIVPATWVVYHWAF